jgi:N-acetyl-anhydromuramyl-L-alanine amidase AmpD
VKNLSLISAFIIFSNISLSYSNTENISNIEIDKSRARNISSWKEKISKYSNRHYKENTWELEPKVIVLHYTVSKTFPWNLVNSTSFANEEPGLASHYVVDKEKIWEILPTNIRSRGAYGINHVAINIEMVAMNSNELFKDKKTLNNTIKLVKYLMNKHNIPINKIYSHQDVSKMNKKITPEIKDLVDSRAYGKIDPGENNMIYIKSYFK